jgi:hypothetical protein
MLMSGGQFHVHGPHDHAVEHGAHGGDELATRIAVMTAVLSTVGAVFSYQGGHAQNEAMMYKNEAVLKKTEASDQWNFYQSKSSKQNLAELGQALAPAGKKSFYDAEIARYRKEKTEIESEARRLEAAARQFNELSDRSLHPHQRLAQATTFVQIAISLAAITVLTRRRWLYWGSMTSAGAGIVFWLLAWIR